VYQAAKHDHTVTQYVVEHCYYVTAIDLISNGKVVETYVTERGKLSKAGLPPKYAIYAWAEDDYYILREAALILDKTSEEIRQMFDDLGAEYHGLHRRIPVRTVHDKMLPVHFKDHYHKARTLLEAPRKVQDSETLEIRDGLRNLEEEMKSLQQQMKLAEAQAQTTEQVRLETRKEREQLLLRLEEEIAERSRLQRELQMIRGSWWRRIGKTKS
jgi:hypothetical protein